MDSNQSNNKILNLIKSTAICFCNLENIKEYFNGDYIVGFYNDFHDTEEMVLTCSIKEIVNVYNDLDTFDLSLELFSSKFYPMINNLNSGQNNSNL